MELQIFTLLKPWFLVNVQRLVVLVCGQSRQLVNHSGFAQHFLCEPKTKSKNVSKFRTLTYEKIRGRNKPAYFPPVVICLKLLIHHLCRTLISWLVGLAENPSVRQTISV